MLFLYSIKIYRYIRNIVYESIQQLRIDATDVKAHYNQLHKIHVRIG